MVAINEIKESDNPFEKAFKKMFGNPSKSIEESAKQIAAANAQVLDTALYTKYTVSDRAQSNQGYTTAGGLGNGYGGPLNNKPWTLGDSISIDPSTWNGQFSAKPNFDNLEIGHANTPRTQINSKVTMFGKVTIWSEDKVPNKIVQWVHKKFFGIVWTDISCSKCASRLSCLVNKSFENNCRVK